VQYRTLGHLFTALYVSFDTSIGMTAEAAIARAMAFGGHADSDQTQSALGLIASFTPCLAK